MVGGEVEGSDVAVAVVGVWLLVLGVDALELGFVGDDVQPVRGSIAARQMATA